MEDSRISLRKFIRALIRHNLKVLSYGMNTDLSMTWSPKLLNQMEDSYGHVRITMEMSNQISLPKVMDHLDS